MSIERLILFLAFVSTAAIISYEAGQNAAFEKTEQSSSAERLEVHCREFPADALCIRQKQ